MLNITDLSLHLSANKFVHAILQNITLTINKGETLALIGQSGAGKTMTAYALMNLLPADAIMSGNIELNGQNLQHEDMTQIRGNKIAMIFQHPQHAFNPLHTIGTQIAESLWIHQRITSPDAPHIIADQLLQVGLRYPFDIMQKYPHQLSGGQCQRAMIAMALINKPDLLIADEPTTALDAVLQHQILDLLLFLQAKHQMSCLFITHHIGIAKKMAHRLAVIEKGEIIEQSINKGAGIKLKTAYGKQLIDALPHSKTPHHKSISTQICLQVNQLNVRYHQASTKACDNINLIVKQGETLGIVGKSGSGKSTLAQAILRILPENTQQTGEIWLGDKNINALSNKQLKPLRRHMQLLFQQPIAALPPHMQIADIIAEAPDLQKLWHNKTERQQKITAMMAQMGLDSTLENRYPHQLSGGQAQRIALARALMLQPKLLILDEPTAALDMVHQAQIIALLKQLQAELKLSYLFISHDIALIQSIAHHIIVIDDGAIIEKNANPALFQNPAHEITKQLIEASSFT
ncbi:MAG: nickel ABC transporter ATP-binding protein NikE [Alphaproteobacteria bacterium]|nr:nickel ABC transporter ATP-binding protein NikE [Alphaproteobacteria bacterium]